MLVISCHNVGLIALSHQTEGSIHDVKFAVRD